MNVTLFVGNGFDLGLGLKTRYTDFYEYYKVLPSSTDYIEEKKDDIKNNITLWSDLEAKLRDEAMNLRGESIGDFLEFQDDLTDSLSDYLEKENRVFYDQSEDEKETLCRDILLGLQRITTRTEALFPELKDEKGAANLKCVFNFNYTFSLEDILRGRKRGIRILHPHGDLRSSVVIGAYDIPYRMPIEYFESYNYEEIDKWLIKERTIANVAKLRSRYGEALARIIDSDVICIYGMSLGDSDRMWWMLILQWLINDEKHRLVVFSHSLNGLKKSKSPRKQAFMRGDSIKERFAAFGEYGNNEIRENVLSRITVLPDEGIFDARIIRRDSEDAETMPRKEMVRVYQGIQ